MPPVTIDACPALVVIDLQAGIVDLPTVHPSAEIVGRAAELAAAFRDRALPVVLVNVAGQAAGRTEYTSAAGPLPAGWADLVPALGSHTSDHRVTKLQWGAFHDTDLHAHLQSLGVTQTVVAGIATSMGVESTARSAHEHGYHVVLVTDAMTDFSDPAHQHSIGHVFPQLGQRTTTSELITLLQDRAEVR